MAQKKSGNGGIQDDYLGYILVVRWFSEEEYTDKALEIRERIRMGEEKVVVPDLLLYELANALKYNSNFDANDVSDALTSIFDMDMDIVTPIPETINSAVTLAFEYNITVYDAFYVALAKFCEIYRKYLRMFQMVKAVKVGIDEIIKYNDAILPIQVKND
jgi:predicted nucleic acid-binding protein